MGHFNIIQLIIIWGPPVLFAITLHEVAHGWVARRFGDPTAQMLGRLTINPLKHIDPIGTIIVPVVLLVLHTGFLFGWAKPVPISPRNFKNPRRDMAIVAAAGPLSNLGMGIIWALVIRVAALFYPTLPWIEPLIYMGLAGVLINVALLVFNLIPLPPLDGGRVLVGLLPRNAANVVDRIEPYGFYIIILLMITGVFNVILVPSIDWISQILLPSGLLS
ncbi:MAG TPA: site-2 protease family protein [Gammaproteobacteria bacterium]|nr:site-2 protease family protein [Gammaproteobacteria bacterium]